MGFSLGFGSKKSKSSSEETRDLAQTGTSQLKIDKEGIMAFIDEALSGAGGLAEIFGKEGAAGIYSSSVAKQEAGDLLGQIAGELAKLTGVTETTGTETGTVKTKGSSKSKSLSLGF